MHIIVTGGNGFVGKELLGLAVKKGYDVTYLARHEGGGYPFNHPQVHYRYSDLVNDKDFPQINNADALIHLVGAIKPKDLKKGNVKSLEGSIKFAKSNQIDTVILLSAKMGYPAYVRSKQKAESLLKQSGLKYGILQSSLIFGRERPLANTIGHFAQMFQGVPFINIPIKLLHPIPVQDVAEKLLCLVESHPQKRILNLFPSYLVPKKE